jgi:hypothetical protein
VALSDAETIKRCRQRLVGLKNERARGWESEWRDIAQVCQPRRSRFLTSDANRGDRRNRRLKDNHAIWASGVLQNGMASGITSKAMPWFKLTVADDDLAEFGPVKETLDDYTERLRTLFADTNFYSAAKTVYGELGLFGTGSLVTVEHPKRMAVFFPLTAGEYWIALSTALEPHVLYRQTAMTAEQMVAMFGRQKVRQTVRDAYDRGNADTTFTVIHAIEPNDDRDLRSKSARDMAFRSVYFEEGSGDTDMPLRVSGYESQPFVAPRWDVLGSDSYGTGPGSISLEDVRGLQHAAKRRMHAMDYLVMPHLKGPAKLAAAHNGFMPGEMTAVAAADDGQVGPMWTVPPQALSAIQVDVDGYHQRISRAYYADLFLAITNMPGVQPRTLEEIARRNEEKLSQLGPVMDRLDNEMLIPLIDRTFDLAWRSGLLPPPPEELHRQPLKIKFSSILHQLQEMAGLAPIERTAAFVGNLAGVWREAADKLDPDQAIDEYARRTGAPARVIRSDEKVDQVRQARASQELQAQAAQMAPAVKDGAQAYKLLAEAQQRSAA